MVAAPSTAWRRLIAHQCAAERLGNRTLPDSTGPRQFSKSKRGEDMSNQARRKGDTAFACASLDEALPQLRRPPAPPS